MEKIQIKLKRGLARTTEVQRANLKGLGLRKRESISIVADTEANRGMIRRVIHMLDVSRPNAESETKKSGVAVEVKPVSTEAKKAAPKKKTTKKKVAKKTATKSTKEKKS